MSRVSSRASHRMLRVGALLAAVVLLGGPTLVAGDEAEPTVMSVQEDWMLWVYEPAGSVSAPQFHTIMSPAADLDSFFFRVTWNYWESPLFEPGGFQVQNWNGSSLVSTNSIGNAQLSLYAEFITWTQVMQTDGTQLGFTIINGQSVTWGEFGYPETFIVTDGSVSNLNGYSPDLSVASSAITYGRNRVILLVLNAVRYYDEEHNLIREDATQRSVFRIFD